MAKGSSINYVSTFEGGGGIKMLTIADVGEGGVSDLLMSAKKSYTNLPKIRLCTKKFKIQKAM